jgi:hypothetical protein
MPTFTTTLCLWCLWCLWWFWWSDCLGLVLGDNGDGGGSDDWSNNLILLFDRSHDHILPHRLHLFSRWGILWNCDTDVFSLVISARATCTLSQAQIPNWFLSRAGDTGCVVEVGFVVRAIGYIGIHCPGEVTKSNLGFGQASVNPLPGIQISLDNVIGDICKSWGGLGGYLFGLGLGFGNGFAAFGIEGVLNRLKVVELPLEFRSDGIHLGTSLLQRDIVF